MASKADQEVKSCSCRPKPDSGFIRTFFRQGRAWLHCGLSQNTDTYPLSQFRLCPLQRHKKSPFLYKARPAIIYSSLSSSSSYTGPALPALYLLYKPWIVAQHAKSTKTVKRPSIFWAAIISERLAPNIKMPKTQKNECQLLCCILFIFWPQLPDFLFIVDPFKLIYPILNGVIVLRKKWEKHEAKRWREHNAFRLPCSFFINGNSNCTKRQCWETIVWNFQEGIKTLAFKHNLKYISLSFNGWLYDD